MTERLIEGLQLNEKEPFLIYFGDFVNDFFCGLNYTCDPVDVALWRYFRAQQYQRIVFFEGANKLYWYDERSRSLCRRQTSSPSASSVNAPPVNAPPPAGMRMGPMGGRNLLAASRSPGHGPSDTPAPAESASPIPAAAPRRSMSDVAALELMDFILVQDTTPVSTALIFTHANDLNRRNLGGENTFREFQSRMVNWAKAASKNPSVVVFIFQNATQKEVLEACHSQELTALENFMNRHKDRSGHIRKVGSPSAPEILRLIHRRRLLHRLQVDWAFLQHLADFLGRQPLRLTFLQSRLASLKALNREVLQDWAHEQVVCAKDHVIQNLGARTQAVDATALKAALTPVIGQQDSAAIMVRAVVNWIANPKKAAPLTLFLAGTSGVGKTFSVKLMAEALQIYGFDFSDFQMNEYSEEHRVSSLIGSPPGYVGSEEEPLLFRQLRQSNRLVILFDEIEKAHKRVLMSLMQLMAEGVLSWHGGRGDFRECIICFTSNARMQELTDLKASIRKASQTLDMPDIQNQIRDVLLRSEIAPEFLGRINHFLIYSPLTAEDVLRITVQEVHLLAARHDLEVSSIHSEFPAQVALKTADSIYGARPVADTVKLTLETGITELLRDVRPPTHICIIKTEQGGFKAVRETGESFTASDKEDQQRDILRQYRELERRERFLDVSLLRESLAPVFCQQDEITLLTHDIVNWFAQKNKERPLSLMLAGTSGVGKTYSCRLLAQALADQRYLEAYFPMNQFSQESHEANLTGSAAGFIGSDKTPKLFEALQRSNRLVIVFDEIEKAHPKILSVLMQMLDVGVMTWNSQEWDFRQCIVCFTTNAQQQELLRLKSGWTYAGRDTGSPEFQEAVRQVFVRDGIAPEICGRINRFCVYNPLTPEAIFRIALAEMQKLAQKYDLNLISASPSLLADIAVSVAGSTAFGARPVTRRIETDLGALLPKFASANPDSGPVVCREGSNGLEIAPATVESAVEDTTTLFEQAQTAYEELKHTRSFLNTQSLKQALAQIRSQDDCIEPLVDWLDLWYAESGKDKPFSVFMVGPSGVGKTFTGKLLAESLRPYGYEYVYLAMTEYSQESAVNNLHGSSRGYVGSEDTPLLFRSLERSSRLVIVFDEIEKAHHTVFKTLMQLIEVGTLSWSRGEGDFRECILIFTSNLLQAAMTDLKADFQARGHTAKSAPFREEIKALLIQSGLAPELCGRINRFLVYNPLTLTAVVDIVFLEVKKLCHRHGCTVDWVAPRLLAQVARLTAGSSSGAREVRDQVEMLLGSPLLKFKKQFVHPPRMRIDLVKDSGSELVVEGTIDRTDEHGDWTDFRILIQPVDDDAVASDADEMLAEALSIVLGDERD